MEYNLEAFKSDTLAVQLLAGGMTATLAGGNFTDTPAGMETILTLEPKVAAKKEIISCTISGSTVTITARGLDGTSAVQHEVNAVVIVSFTPTHYTSIKSGAAQALRDGWQSFGKTLTYQSATTMSGTDFLANNSVGDKVKLNQSIPLTAYWPMEDKDDDMGVATVANIGTPTYTAGKFGNALTLNGTDQALAITDAAVFKPTGAFSFGFWFKSSSAALMNMFQSKSYAGNAYGIGVILNGGVPTLQIGNGTATSSIAGVSNYANGSMHYLVASYQNNFGKLFIDGVLVGSGYAVTPQYAGTTYTRIGCANDSGANILWFSGQIDDLFFINGHAVDQYWVAAKYAEGTAQTTANITATYQGYVTALTDTLLTLTGGADYALYNGTITSPYYSKASSPVGFPQWFNYQFSVSGSGGSAGSFSITRNSNRFNISGRQVNFKQTVQFSNLGSYSGPVRIGYPVNCAPTLQDNMMNGTISPLVTNPYVNARGVANQLAGITTYFEFVKQSYQASVQWSDLSANDIVFINSSYEI